MKDHLTHDPDNRPGPHVLIVGGGASGVLMAAHLLAQSDAQFRVTIIEGRNMLGCGVAYSTTDPDHLLNTRVLNMSAYPDDPQNFLRWLQARPEGQGKTAESFVSRAVYGAYMADLLKPWQHAPAATRRLRCVQQNCLRIDETPRGCVAHLDDGQSLIGDRLILATGHVQPEPDPSGLLTGPWQAFDPAKADQRIVIIGSGLSMVDQLLSILKSGHRGEIVTVSRRGQFPRAHKPTHPLSLGPADIPLGAPVSRLLFWARGLAARAKAQGGTWRDAVDAIRPHVRSIWRAWPQAERARFLRHAAVLWDVHRHRMPPESDAEMRAAKARGQLILRRAAFLGTEPGPDGTPMVILRDHGAVGPVRLAAGRVIDCRGIRHDPERNATPLFADLLARGRARIDPLRIGLDVDRFCHLLPGEGEALTRVQAIGPVTRAAFWEITAIPDIREQTARLAQDMAADLAWAGV
jgi:uncharacterized NAD(P)/FAD-binding protein YdhS